MSNRRMSVLALVAMAGLTAGAGMVAAQPKAAEPAKGAAPTAAAPAADNLPSGKEVMERAIAAVGGREKLEKVTSRVTTGNFEMPAMGIKGSIKLMQAAPNLVAIKTEIPGMGTMVQGHDGNVAWDMNPAAGARLLDGDEKSQFLRGSVLNVELQYEKMFKEVKTVGIENVADKPAYKLELTPIEKGEKQTMFFDKESGLLVKQASTMQSQMGEVAMVTLVEDYRDVDGIKMPFRMRQQVMNMEQTMTFDTIVHNKDVPADAFVMPAEVKALMEKEAKAPKAPADAKPGEGEKKGG